MNNQRHDEQEYIEQLTSRTRALRLLVVAFALNFLLAVYAIFSGDTTVASVSLALVVITLLVSLVVMRQAGRA